MILELPIEVPISAPIICDMMYIFTLSPFFNLIKATVTEGLRCPPVKGAAADTAK